MKSGQIIAAGLLSTVLALSPGVSFAQLTTQRISASQAQGLGKAIPTITVWSGAGTNLSFISTGETIKKVWLDDPSRITLDFDGALCQFSPKTDRQQNCEGENASVIHLRRIHSLKFPNLPRTASTLLSVITQAEGSGKRQLYHFQVALGTGSPKYHSVAIYPDASSPISAGTVQAETTQVQLTQVEAGLFLAQSRGLIQSQQPLWKRVQGFMVLARNGTAIQQAAQQAGISLALVAKLAELGKSQLVPASVLPRGVATPPNIQSPVPVAPGLPSPLSR